MRVDHFRRALAGSAAGDAADRCARCRADRARDRSDRRARHRASARADTGAELVLARRAAFGRVGVLGDFLAGEAAGDGADDAAGDRSERAGDGADGRARDGATRGTDAGPHGVGARRLGDGSRFSGFDFDIASLLGAHRIAVTGWDGDGDPRRLRHARRAPRADQSDAGGAPCRPISRAGRAVAQRIEKAAAKPVCAAKIFFDLGPLITLCITRLRSRAGSLSAQLAWIRFGARFCSSAAPAPESAAMGLSGSRSLR